MKSIWRALAGLALLVASGSMGSPGSAAVAAPISVGGYYADTLTKTCTNASGCAAFFSDIPTGKLVIITQASCEFAFNGTAALYQVTLSGSGKSMWLRPLYVGTVNGFRQYTVNDPVLVFYSSATGIQPFMSVLATAAVPSMTMKCTIAGTIK